MPLRRLVVERKKKSKKARPPRIYKRKGVKYIRPGKNKIKVSDVNLIINNTIASRSRGGNPRGAQNTRALQKKAKELMEARAKLNQLQTDLLISENKKKDALRIQQIKEESLAKTDEEKQALLKTHAEELKYYNDQFAEREAKVMAAVNDKSTGLEALRDQLNDLHKKELLPYKAAAAELQRRLGNLRTGVDKRKQIAADKSYQKEAEDIKNRITEFRLPPKKGAIAAADSKLDNPTMDDGLTPPVSTIAIAAQAPVERKDNLDINDDEAIQPLPIISSGKKSGSCGMSNYQIDAAMEDEPMYLKTISADEIPELYIMANLALDEYKQCGFIVNVDPRGVVDRQHWVAVYIDCDVENVCYYYDSFGEPPTPMIAAGLKALINKLDIPHYLAFEYNTIVNQDMNSSRCGIHCILTLTELFSGMSTELAGDHNEGAAKAFQHYI